MDRHHLLIIRWMLVMAVSLVSLFSIPNSGMADNETHYQMESVPVPHPKMRRSPAQEQDGGQPCLSVIIKVKSAGYVPEWIKVRTRISPLLFTAIISAQTLPALLEDPNVLSVEQSKLMNSQDKR
jgi:hypothetical protein